MRQECFLCLLAVAMVSCTSAPPAPPQPVEETRRPANSELGIELQSCQADLAASRAALDAAVRANAQRAALANTLYIVNFPFGDATVHLSDADSSRLLADARNASTILIRGRADAANESAAGRRLASRRAAAIFEFLKAQGVEPSRMSRTYQGHANAESLCSDMPSGVNARRVEIEIYHLPPRVVTLSVEGAK